MTSRHVRYVREFPDNNNHKGAQSTLVACGPLRSILLFMISMIYAIEVKFETDFTTVATMVSAISLYAPCGALKAKYIVLLDMMVIESTKLISD